jgi:hypothetical protein
MRSGSFVVRPMSSLGTASWRRSETRRASLPAASARSSHGRRSRSASLLAMVSSRGSGAARSASSAARLAGAEKIASCSRRPQPASSASIFSARTTAPPSGNSMYSSRYQRSFS